MADQSEVRNLIDKNNNNKDNPENYQNNLAFYKREKSEKDEKKEKLSIAMSSTASSSSSTTPTSETSLPSENSTRIWADITCSYKQSSSATKTRGQRVTKTEIQPNFCPEDPGYDWIVVSPTHFNNKTFKGYVTQE